MIHATGEKVSEVDDPAAEPAGPAHRPSTPPLTERQRERRRRILHATAQLACRGGFEAVQMREVSDLDRTPAGAEKVWTYLIDAGKKISHYASDPLWKTVSGPYTLKSFSTAGKVELVENEKYDGGGAAQVGQINLLSFTTVAAEENALRAGTVDYGYIKASDLGIKKSFTDLGYHVERSCPAGPSPTCLTTSTTRRWAPSSGSCTPGRPSRCPSTARRPWPRCSTTAPPYPPTAPSRRGRRPPSSRTSRRPAPYPFSNSEARKLLTDHGWSPKDGTMVCTSPGEGAGHCGEGVEKGTEFRMRVLSSPAPRRRTT
ncbi:hypothetical protein SVIOM342S_04511 [Streptomyces violaceorubidus]